MKKEELRPPRNEALVKVTEEANGIFTALCAEVESQVKAGNAELDVLKIARKSGLQLDEKDLEELQIDRIIIAKPWLPVYVYFPWRPLWCYWWRRYHPWYRCCHWWWYRCHPYHYHW